MRLRHLFSLLLLLSVAAHVWAQISGGLQGRVTDASGASIARAQVTVTRTSTGVAQKTETTADGYYTFAQLLPGTLFGRGCGDGICGCAAARHHGCDRAGGAGGCAR